MSKNSIMLFVVLGFIFLLAFFNTRAKKITPPESKAIIPIEYKIVLECQKLSAITVNENWSYKECIKSLNEAISPEAKILKTL